MNEDLDQVKSRKEENLKADNGSVKELEAKENQLSNDLTRLNTARDIAMDNLTEENQTYPIKPTIGTNKTTISPESNSFR